jgi:hypothetical protein
MRLSALIPLVLFSFAAVACSHHHTTIEVNQQNDCLKEVEGPRLPESVKKDSPEMVAANTYLAKTKAVVFPYFRDGVKNGMQKLKAEGIHFRVTNPQHELVAGVMLYVNKDGKILNHRRICTFGVQELDEAFDESLQKLKQLEPPPGILLGPEQFARVRWNFVLKN